VLSVEDVEGGKLQFWLQLLNLVDDIITRSQGQFPQKQAPIHTQKGSWGSTSPLHGHKGKDDTSAGGRKERNLQVQGRNGVSM